MFFLSFVQENQIYYYKGRSKSGNIIYLSKRLSKKVIRFDSYQDAFNVAVYIFPRYDFDVHEF